MKKRRTELKKGQQVFVKLSAIIELPEGFNTFLPFGLVGTVQERIDQGRKEEYDRYLVEISAFRFSEPVGRMFQRELEVINGFVSNFSQFDGISGKWIFPIFLGACVTDFRTVF